MREAQFVRCSEGNSIDSAGDSAARSRPPARPWGDVLCKLREVGRWQLRCTEPVARAAVWQLQFRSRYLFSFSTLAAMSGITVMRYVSFSHVSIQTVSFGLDSFASR